MQYSAVGFGSYRIDISIKEHYDALLKSLLSGINVIDTSANYSDGRSEMLVGKVITDLISENKIERKNIILITKGGYIQGQNFKLASSLKKDGKPFSEVVEFSERLWHCISPDFLEDQLNRQLFRLNQSYIDVYLLHNPEYFFGKAKDDGLPLIEAREIFYGRIKKAFEYLEEKAAEGKILSYGISSNTFNSHSSEYDFTSLEKVLEIAESISPENHFRVIQFPLNLFEAGAVINKNQHGNSKTLLELSKESGLTALVNRPLNAVTSKGLVRLADYKWDAFVEKDFIKQIKLVTLMEEDFLSEKIASVISDENDIKKFKSILNFGKTIDENWKFFGSIEHYNDMISQIFAPKISQLITLCGEKFSDESIDEYSGKYINECYRLLNFVSNYYKMKAEKRGRFIHSLIDKYLDEKYHGLSLSQKAFLITLSAGGVSCVLAGIRKEKYVDDAIEILSQEKIKNAGEIIKFVSEEVEFADR